MGSDRRAALALTCFMAEYGWPLRVPAGKMTIRELWSCPDRLLAGLLKLPAAETWRIEAFRRSFSAGQMFEELRRKDVTLVTLGEEGYPPCLAEIHDPPLAIFFKGSTDRLDEFMRQPRLAIVGARRASLYGIDAATALAGGLSRHGVCVISGMAFGIDSAAHRGALESRGGTIAVLGCGPDVVYPVTNRLLYASLLESGLVISEYPPGTRPRPWRFPARNRIISGLSRGVVVVEAKEKSGALITADFALDQGRDVFAVPGSIFSDLSIGPNRLVRGGATIVTGAGDILEEYGMELESTQEKSVRETPQDLEENEKLVLKATSERPRHQDELAARSGVDGASTAAALVSLEIRGLLKFEQGHGFRRSNSS
ncbi:MAG: DNA-processing protein DprA [Thermoleophilia bacterium]